ncbi:uncharacterized protein G2W53_015688 [Senna tora]|uniref:Retrotransposon Copia-like N-terminal domain-containing protein n=1 Tax=Senna tora TaxID=362788 RepID=A0A835C863_9FABA|nr:uncharacterized protein G2W53_015688 [Senna tora]
MSTGIDEEQSSNNKELHGQKNAFQELYERKDPYYIHPSNNTGVHLVTNLLNENNYLVWSRSMWIALKVKNKLLLINSSSEPYMFTPTANELWKDLKEKYGDADRHQIFNLRKKMNVIEQGNDSLATYSNNLKRILDQIACLRPPPKCNCCKCGAFKKIEEERSDDIVMMFLMGTNAKSLYKKKDKADRHYNHCNKDGHTEEACFKKHGYLEWFKEYKERRKGTTYANVVNTSSVKETEGKGKKEELDLSSITEFIKKEMQKYGNKESKEPVVETPVDTGYFADFAGMTHDTVTRNTESVACWIIDSGDSSHIWGDKRLLTDLRVKSGKNTVTLPDGNVKIVKMIGKVVLNFKIILDDVLFVPEFKYNIISVGKLSNATGMQVIFDKSSCMVQDLLSKETMVIGHLKGNLYLLDNGAEGFQNHFVCSVDNVDTKKTFLDADKNVAGFDSQEPHSVPCFSSSLEVPREVSGAREESPTT